MYNLENDFLTTETLIETGKKGDFKVALSDEKYDAQIVGVVTKMNTSKDSGNEYRAYNLIFQIKDDDGKVTHVASKNLTPSLSAKSTLTTYMKGWLKQTDPTAITEALKTAGIITDKGFNFIGFIGKQCKVDIAMTPSTKDASKLYPVIGNITPSKKENAYTAVKGSISKAQLFMRDIDGMKFLDFIEIKEKVNKEPTADAKALGLDKEDEQNSSDLPF